VSQTRLGITIVTAIVLAACSQELNVGPLAPHTDRSSLKPLGSCLLIKGEIFGNSNTTSGGTDTLRLIPRDPAHQRTTNVTQSPHLDTFEISHRGCTDDSRGDWAWFSILQSPLCQSADSDAHPSPTINLRESHCVNPGRFILRRGGFPTIVDLTSFPTSLNVGGLAIHVEDPTVMNAGPSDQTSDVIVHENQNFVEEIVPRVHYGFAQTPSAGWPDDNTYPNPAKLISEDSMISSSTQARWLRIGAWDAMSTTHNGALLMRFLWENGQDNDSASGYTNHKADLGLLARVHFMPLGCGIVTAQFRSSNGHSAQLNIPYRVGPTCQYYTLSTPVSGYGTVERSTGLTGAVGAYPAGTVETLYAHATAPQRFLGWSYDCSTTDTTCVITVNADKTAQANFSSPFHADFNHSPSPVKSGVSCTWTANVEGGTRPYSYSWSSPGLPGTTDSTYTINPTPSGEFTVYLTVSDGVSTANLSTHVTINNSQAPNCLY
jgi:hypothetical protein